MKPDEAQIRSVIRTVWWTQLGLEIRNTDASAVSSDSSRMTAAVHISGDFSGGVRVECSRAIVRRAASIMFAQPADRLNDADDRDVIGELTNVIAGNIKALIAGKNTISMPTIIEGTDYKISDLDAKTCGDFGFSLDGEPITVTVFEFRG